MIRQKLRCVHITRLVCCGLPKINEDYRSSLSLCSVSSYGLPEIKNVYRSNLSLCSANSCSLSKINEYYRSILWLIVTATKLFPTEHVFNKNIIYRGNMAVYLLQLKPEPFLFRDKEKRSSAELFAWSVHIHLTF